MKPLKDFVQDNGGMLAVLAVVVVVLGGYAEWRIAENVFTTVAGEHLAKAEAVDDLREDLEDDVADLKAATEKLDGKVDQIITILLTEEN